VLHGVTKFADMTLSEFEQRVLMRPPPLPEKRPHFLPNSIDFNVLPPSSTAPTQERSSSSSTASHQLAAGSGTCGF